MGVRSILLVDDDIDEHEIFQIALQMVSTDAVCHAFTDPVQAIQKIKEDNLQFDVIFVDLNMPKVDGFKFLEMAKRLPSIKQTPIYIFSTTSCPEIAAKVLAMGAETFVSKFSAIEPFVKFLSTLF